MMRICMGSCFRLGMITAVAALASAVDLGAQTAPTTTSALTPKVLHACYVPASGTVYRIKEPGTPQRCNGGPHIEFSWTDGDGALRSGDDAGGDLDGSYPEPTVVRLQGRAVAPDAPQDAHALVWNDGAWRPTALPSGVTAHGALNGLEADDHPQYLLADGSRGLTDVWNIGGFRIAGIAQATTAGDAVPFEQAVKGGDAAQGDLTGSYPEPLVSGIRGRPISNLAPQAGHVLTYDGGEWTPSAPSSGVSAHGQLAGLEADDHPQYLLADGVRNSANGFAVTGTSGAGAIPAEGGGTRMMWYPRKAAFRAGSVGAFGTHWDDANIGVSSVAMGSNTRASGEHSLAMGLNTVASGYSSTALGENTTASGDFGTALGLGTRASGFSSTAIGRLSTASGGLSTAIGSLASTDNKQGSFVYGDASTLGDASEVRPTAANQFVVRAAGGTIFYSSSDLAAGVSLAAGGGAWLTVSDVNRKHLFRSLDGEEVLRKLAAMPIQEWSYLSQDPSVRHLGPTAQDFHAAFGLGEDELRINTIDISGINMLAIQALEKRTAELREHADRVQDLEGRVRQLERRLSLLEAQLRQ